VLDHKTSLQELATRLFDAAPVYAVREEGPDHSKEFFATVTIAGQAWGAGEGRSKKQAEQAAAEMARDALIEEASHTVAGNA
jgi:ribonuclease-3